MKCVTDTSVIIDGRITMLIERNELKKPEIIIPEAVISELEFQANNGRESGFNGLDELIKLRTLEKEGLVTLFYVGNRPTQSDIRLAKSGGIDALIRELAVAEKATLITSDRVQARVAESKGLSVKYIEPKVDTTEFEDLEILTFFDETTMSVHLKEGCVPYAKKGTPGTMKLVQIGKKALSYKRLDGVAKQITENALRYPDSFIEIERKGATVVQLGTLRISIARTPFADALEITAVRPVARLSIDDYALSAELKKRLSDYNRGVFISGPPGSGKSTFSQSVTEYLRQQNYVVKTMESPRDLQVHDEVTQYAPLEGSMEKTSDILLLVRPDYTVYDEVRKTEDFRIFADMRLAGVGLIGVVHANRAVDAIQRLIGRVELGIIPQVIDTVVHIEKGAIKEVYELSFTVKVPSGMKEQDLARPVIQVSNFETKKQLYEIYTYGEQVVVIPVKEQELREDSPVRRLAAIAIADEIKAYCHGRVSAEVVDDESATVYVDERDIARVVGKGGQLISAIEQQLGVRIDVRSFSERGGKKKRKK